MTALALLLALLVGALLVALGLVGSAWWHRRAEARELVARAEAAEAEYREISTRQTRLLRELDIARADHADAIRELGEERARRTSADLPRRIEREQERWADLINRVVPVDRAGKYVPTPREAAEWADLDRRLEES